MRVEVRDEFLLIDVVCVIGDLVSFLAADGEDYGDYYVFREEEAWFKALGKRRLA